MVIGILLAVVVSITGHDITIDKGLIDGLRPGDSAHIGYYVTVNGVEKKWIETGRGHVLEAHDSRSVVRLEQPGRAAPGFFVRFDVPAERTSPALLLSVAQKRLADGNCSSALLFLYRIKQTVPGDAFIESLIKEAERRQEPPPPRNPELERVAEYLAQAEQSVKADNCAEALVNVGRVLKIVPDHRRARLLKDYVEKEAERRRSMLRVPAGKFHIGVDLKESKFYNQHPRFQKELNGFWIDRVATQLTGYSYQQAENYCKKQGKRLPTEFELEAAAGRPGFEPSPNAEWSSSWYLPYPGNYIPERDYGEKYRVIRGPEDIRLRTFLSPGDKPADTAFRCACDPMDLAGGTARRDENAR